MTKDLIEVFYDRLSDGWKLSPPEDDIEQPFETREQAVMEAKELKRETGCEACVEGKGGDVRYL